MDQPENISSTSINPPLPNSGTIEEFQSPKSHKPLIIGLAILVVLLATAMAYVYAQNQSLKSQLGLPRFKLGSAKTCDYNGQTYQIGEEVPSINGCNNCNCDTNGQVACIDMACNDEDTEMDPSASWERYTNDKYSFNYPDTWTIATSQAESNDVIRSEYDSGLRAGPLENDIPTPYVLSVRTHLNETNIENIIDILEPGVLDEYRPTYSKFKAGDHSGYLSHSFSSMYGQADVFLPINNNMIQLTLWPFDKNNPHDLQEQAWQDFSQILSTFEFNDLTTSSSTDLKKYQNEQYNFTFEYPQDWQVRDMLSTNSSLPLYKNEKMFLGIAPKTIQEDFLASIRVINSDLQSIIDQVKFIPEGTPNKIISENKISFAGLSAIEIITTNTSTGESGKTIIFKKDSLVYVISGWDEENTHALKDILVTFEFTK